MTRSRWGSWASASPESAPFTIVAEAEVLQTHHFSVRRLTLREGDTTFVRDVEAHPGSVAVVALTRDLDVALVRQFRIPLGRWTLEIPAGRAEVGERASDTARRELLEETGLRARTLVPLTRFANSPGHSTQWTDVFLARECTVGAASPEGIEEQHVSTVLRPMSEVRELVSRGVVCDAKSIVGLLAALEQESLSDVE